PEGEGPGAVPDGPGGARPGAVRGGPRGAEGPGVPGELAVAGDGRAAGGRADRPARLLPAGDPPGPERGRPGPGAGTVGGGGAGLRSEERRVGKECRSGWGPCADR